MIINLNGKRQQEAVQSDWNQNDSTAADYVKNRTHYATQSTEVVLENTTFTAEEVSGMELSQATLSTTNALTEAGVSCNITFDNQNYTCSTFLNSGTILMGNSSLIGGADTGEPFILGFMSSSSIVIYTTTTGSHSISIEKLNTTYKTISWEYMPVKYNEVAFTIPAYSETAWEVGNEYKFVKLNFSSDAGVSGINIKDTDMLFVYLDPTSAAQESYNAIDAFEATGDSFAAFIYGNHTPTQDVPIIVKIFSLE